jgi:methionine sulfoxide reductase heme-binding subunit
VSDRDPLDHAWWLAGRSAGVVAWLLLSLSLVMGMLMATRLAPAGVRAAIRRGHEKVALLALGTVAAHGLLLLGDDWLRPGLSGIVVPFTMDYRPVWTGLGICAGYLTAALSLTYYARRRLGPRRWRLAHRLIPVAWAMAAAHVIGAGSDASALWLQVPLAFTLALAIVLLVDRLMRRPAQRPPAPEPAPPPPPSTAPAPLWSRANL